MNLYPAIDLKDGACVRLLRGDMDKATVFNNDPGSQAGEFVDKGCHWVHVVDLNGAFAGEPVNGAAVDSILAAVGERAKVQLGGGIRNMETVDYWLNKGVHRVILGTVALRNPELVKEACAKWPGRVAVGIDARDGFVAVEGWAETSEITALELAQKFEDCGVSAIIFTDIDRDGAMGGPNIESTVALAKAISTPVIASGGVSSLDDLLAVKAQADAGIDGAISGRALYDGRIDLAEAIAALA
ncbi:1-(5-phosphoribosyl)-5-[(5-phosphoribosylamino)methylideneamino]imidazole-4-carboxamide isomerase [Thalassospira marina]|uniref:1-(5-phosphoribosyl)-5-[(5-phosphoribosylamino)methylideneamino] imidazole-4-carboxamide isomerase n=1 Tax=Thalassospira marina TaxID=2048283 RepID=A0A2N3KW60_9PROT|nr:1-(5-phosphoribosyl)-5-[(5-phosphoribosylamino)methylideneamino]imidazole-4-carboxamide isomerase [Thalassospira marina]AUG54707.1 1-(5-phosphoribosyl)-5-[(5-phosphoribosylamino)methylideneamino]imidazole-4-carboxamide isomerase [Thalassospira marina]PKR54713.1 1-(5-phosphoribosyl)-5-[(5-phosphoribosylamino)methylideneamino]imidazole-4-carboxamide isomerase [Thalassospira marina]